jgi:hypothetical protein
VPIRRFAGSEVKVAGSLFFPVSRLTAIEAFNIGKRLATREDLYAMERLEDGYRGSASPTFRKPDFRRLIGGGEAWTGKAGLAAGLRPHRGLRVGPNDILHSMVS